MQRPDAETSNRPDWDELVRTAAAVRAGLPAPDVAHRPGRARSLLVLLAAGAAAIGATLATVQPRPAEANGTYDSELFTLTNQDRASNGVPSLRGNGTLNGIGEATPYSICGIRVDGRAQDMVNRSYFSHYIPPCNQLVFVIMQEAGIHYLSAGENVGWESYASDPAAYINQAFMNSSDHRANILNRNYTDLGIGSAYPFNDSALGATNGWMFAEEFAQLGSTAPKPAPTAAPVASHPNSTPPPGPTLPAPVATVVPTQAPTPTPAPTPYPTPNPFTTTIGPGLPPPLIYQQGGLLSDSVESVLESYLID